MRNLLKATQVTIAFSLTMTMLSSQADAQPYIHKKYSYAIGQCSHIVAGAAKNTDAVVAYYRSVAANSYLDLLRIDTMGTTVWARSFDLVNNEMVPVNMVATADTGSLVFLADTSQMKQIGLLKVSKTGIVQWMKTLNAEYYSAYPFPSIALEDGTIFFSYPSNDTVFIQRMDAAGNIVSGNSYVKSSTSVISPSSMVLSQGAIYLGGYDNDSYSGFLLKTDTLGNILWQQTGIAGGSISMNLQPITGGGVLLTTQSNNPFGGNLSATRMASIRPDGTVNWAMKIPRFDNAKLIAVNSSTFAICSHKNAIISFALIDTAGLLLNTVSYTDSIATILFDATPVFNNSVWISSVGSNYIWLMRASAAGSTSCFEKADTLSLQPFSFPSGSLNLQAHPFSATLSNSLLSSNTASFTVSDLCFPTTINLLQLEDHIITPNPTSGIFSIGHKGDIVRFTIMAMSGKLHYEDVVPKNGLVDISNLTPGIYILRLYDRNGNVSVRKLVKQ
ncbi:MAG: T9SS type A sorting domain-containing protein [Flavipsychrobacter sp.]|nr:T9SS type A sorting domain-containing protein [Flavipsychrobacter sp.]